MEKQNKAMEELAQEILREFKFVAGDRGNWESHWKEIAERVLPSQSNSFNSFNQYNQTQGEKRTEFIFDSTPSIALNRFSAILDSLLTPRNSMWHKLIASDPNLMKDRNVQLYFDEVNRRLFKYRYTPRANFSSQNQQNYKSLGAFGTGALFIDDLFNEPGVRYKAIHLSELFFVENHQGMVDKVLRHFPLTARQAFQKWGTNLPDAIMTSLSTNPDRTFFFLHCVKPNTERNYERFDYQGMPFTSYYLSMEGGNIIEVGGYNTFPYAISRYEQAPGEVYGRSPAMEVLPAIKTLNEEKKTILKQGHRTVDPILLVHDDGIIDTFSLKPGALNAGGISADGRPLVQPLAVGNVMIGKDLMDDERAVINDAFLVTLFQILTETGSMTATEVLERTREKGILLAPTLGRQQSEYLGPMIDRELDILSRQGLLPEMPGILREAQGDYNVQYDSPLSRAQRAEEASGLMRTVETALQVVNVTQNLEAIDHFDWDTIIPEISAIQGVPPRWMKSVDQVQQVRQARAQAQQQAQQAQAMPGQAAMLNAATKAQGA